MSKPTILPAEWYLLDESVGDEQWHIPTQLIKQIQQAFIEYLESGLDFQQISAHLDFQGVKEKVQLEVDQDVIDDTCRAYCAAAMSLPHPRLEEIIAYIAQIAIDHRDSITGVLDKIFNVNPLRKYRVIETIDMYHLDQLTLFTFIDDKDIPLWLVINDKNQINKIRAHINDDRLKKGLALVKYQPDRCVGWIENSPNHFAHAEVIRALEVLGEAARSEDPVAVESGQYDRNLFTQHAPFTLDQSWSLESILQHDHEPSLLQMPEVARTIKKFPGRCVDAFFSPLRKTSITQCNQPLIDAAINAFLDAGIEPYSLFSQVCNGVSDVDCDDALETGSVNHDDFLRQAVGYTAGYWSEPLKRCAWTIVSRQPFEELKNACFSDRLKHSLCLIFPEQKMDLLRAMGDAGRENVFSSDLGL